jgi:hypothetical protein
LRDADVLGHRKQLPDAAGGTRRGGELVGRIGLDHDRVARMARHREVVGDRRADDAAADDHDGSHVLSRRSA